MNSKVALTQTPLGPQRLNGLGGLSNYSSPFDSFNNAISFFIGILTFIAALWFLFSLITGGLSYMSAGGDKGKMEEARQKITLGLIGLVVIIAAIFIIGIIGNLLGIDFLTNPGGTIDSLFP
jgi:hypothetical protein